MLHDSCLSELPVCEILFLDRKYPIHYYQNVLCRKMQRRTAKRKLLVSLVISGKNKIKYYCE